MALEGWIAWALVCALALLLLKPGPYARPPVDPEASIDTVRVSLPRLTPQN